MQCLVFVIFIPAFETPVESRSELDNEEASNTLYSFDLILGSFWSCKKDSVLVLKTVLKAWNYCSFA